MKLLLTFLILFSCNQKSSAFLSEKFQYSIKSDDASFYNKAIHSPSRFQTTLDSIDAGIVSHHLYVSHYMADFFYLIQKTKSPVKTIVLIGPNHFSQGKRLISLSKRPWKTPYGFLQPDKKKIDVIIKAKNAGVDEDAFFHEHSIGSLLAFISYHFPDTKVVPIVLNFRLSWEESAKLGILLSQILQKEDLLIISTDFVHDKRNYIIKKIDIKNREKLLNYRENLEVSQVSQIENDCRKCLFSLFHFLENKNKPKGEILLNTNSAEVSGLDVLATSYFFVLYGK